MASGLDASEMVFKAIASMALRASGKHRFGCHVRIMDGAGIL